MRKYIADLNGEKFKSILYRGTYITIKEGDIVKEDAPVRQIFSDLFKEYIEEDIKTSEEVITDCNQETNTIDDFISEDINTYENDDVIIETE